MAICVSKTDNGRQEISEHEDVTDVLEKRVLSMCDELIVQSRDFNIEGFVNELSEYIENYNRILYAPISGFIYTCYNNRSPAEADQLIDSMGENLKAALRFVSQEDYQRKISEDDCAKKKAMQVTKKCILKIYDHVNLAIDQHHSLKQTDEEFRKKFDARFDKEFAESMISEKENLTKEMNAQLITMVGIFTALAFLVFGGISSLDNLFTNQSISIPRLMILGSVWGLCILNLVFVFLFCVGKMTKLNFKSTDDINASVFCKYPIVWWCNFAIIFVLAGSIWIYYLTTRDGLGWLDKICNSSPRLFSVVGSVIFIIIFIIFAIMLSRLTTGQKNKAE